MAKLEPDNCGLLYDSVYENDLEKVTEILCWEDKSAEKSKYRKWQVNQKSGQAWRHSQYHP